jgi:hypothetical protein
MLKRIKAIQQKINKAIDEASLPKTIEAFKELDAGQDRLDLLNDFECFYRNTSWIPEVSKNTLATNVLKK